MRVARAWSREMVFVGALLVGATTVDAGDSDMASTPAQFGQALPEFIRKLRFPDNETGKPILVRCEAMAHLSGVILGTICYSDDHYAIEPRLREVIIRSTKTLRLRPATINGRKENVWFNFSVIYEQTGDEKDIEVLENQLYDLASLGPHYVAAQRSMSKYDVFCFDALEMPISAIVSVSAEGEIAGLALSKNPQTNQCAREIEEVIRGSKFIPATVDGQAVASTFHEIFYHYLYNQGTDRRNR